MKSTVYKIENNKILNLVTGTYFLMDFDMSDSSNNFIYYNSLNNETILVSNRVKIESQNLISIYKIKDEGAIIMFKFYCKPTLILTKVKNSSFLYNRIIAQFYDHTSNLHSYMLIDSDNKHPTPLLFESNDDIRLRKLIFFNSFLKEPYNTNNQYCKRVSDSNFITFKLLNK